ncbi:MAG: hypothetical protein WCX74_03965 [Candidatus Paceibacterota bacterium]
MKLFLSVFVLLIGFVAAGCFSLAIAEDTQLVVDEISPTHFDFNWCPSISAGADKVVSSGGSVEISGYYNDLNGDSVRIRWSASGNRGSFGNEGSLNTIYKAPKVTKNTFITLTLTGDDNRDGIGSDKMTVKVLANGPTPTPTVTPTPIPTTPVPTCTPTQTPTPIPNHKPVVKLVGPNSVYVGQQVKITALAAMPTTTS